MDGISPSDDGHAELLSYLAGAIENAELGNRRIERELHSGPEQRLIATALDLRLSGIGSTTSDIDRIVTELTQIASELRTIGRDAFPAVLADGGLGAGLRALSRRAELPVVVEIADDRRHPLAIELAVFRAVAAALPVCVRAGVERLTVRVEADGAHLEDTSGPRVTVSATPSTLPITLDEVLPLAVRAQIIGVGGGFVVDLAESGRPELRIVIDFGGASTGAGSRR